MKTVLLSTDLDARSATASSLQHQAGQTTLAGFFVTDLFADLKVEINAQRRGGNTMLALQQFLLGRSLKKDGTQ